MARGDDGRRARNHVYSSVASPDRAMNDRPQSGRPAAPTRADFRPFTEIATRWHDNDVYGHVNNTIYYTWFDTAVSRYAMERGLLDPKTSPVIGIVVENGCRFLAQIAYPDAVTLGLRVARLGRSSVRYALGVFRGDEDAASAEGHFVHVYVERGTMRPVPIPPPIRAALDAIGGAAETAPSGS
jgi:acyl-CoA thioester hydrolase